MQSLRPQRVDNVLVLFGVTESEATELKAELGSLGMRGNRRTVQGARRASCCAAIWWRGH